jgi:replicative DNA helicase
MSEDVNTLVGYLGPDFQQGLLWQIVTEPEYAEKIMPLLAVEYFDDPKAKRFFIVLTEFFNENGKPANLQNKSIELAIKKYCNPSDPLDEEYLNNILSKIILWNDRVINRDLLNNGDVLQKEGFNFIIQQEYRKLGEFIIEGVKTGKLKSKETINSIEEKIRKIGVIGDEEDNGIHVLENIDRALRKEFREPTPTGIYAIDQVTGNGLGKGEVGIVLSPSGVGKSTTLTKIANTAVDEGKNVLQIIFEDTEDQIRRKHFTIWSKISLDEIDNNTELVKKRIHDHFNTGEKRGDLLIKKFNDDGTTILDVRRWIDRYQKKYNMKFDMIVLDYLDCLESHKKAVDQNQSELFIIKSFIAMAADYDIPCWSALQTNRTGLDAEWVETHMMGGNIKRLQKSHFVMSIAKTADQREGGELANIKILKARFASDGQMFKNCIFNNKTMEIRITDPKWNVKEMPSTESSLEKIDKTLENTIFSALHERVGGAMDADEDIIKQRAAETDKIMREQQDAKNKRDEDDRILANIGKDFEIPNIEAPTGIIPDYMPNLLDIGWTGETSTSIDIPMMEIDENTATDVEEPTEPISLSETKEALGEGEHVSNIPLPTGKLYYIEPIEKYTPVESDVSIEEKLKVLGKKGFPFTIDDDIGLIDDLYNSLKDS